MRSAHILVALMIGVALCLGGCTANYKTSPQGFGGIPQDLPDNPDPCATYCKEWVPPVYRKVPVLKACSEGRMVPVPYKTRQTRFEEVRIPGKCVQVTGCGKTCEESLVQVKPGGNRWVQTPSGCWKYEYCKPEYKWCNRVEYEEGVEYCVQRPPEYETVAYTECVERTGQVYKPAQYRVEYVDELYVPGHWRWVGKYDPCGPCTDSCNCRKSRTVVVDRKCRWDCPKKKDCVTDGCARCN